MSVKELIDKRAYNREASRKHYNENKDNEDFRIKRRTSYKKWAEKPESKKSKERV